MKQRFWGQLNDFRSFLSPVGWLIQACISLSTLLLLFRPSAWELVLFLLVDSTAFFVCRALIDPRLFLWYSPESSSFFHGIDPELVRKASTSERLALFQALIRF